MTALRRFGLFVALIALVLLSGCGSGGRDDPILRLSAQESLEEGKRLMTEEKYRLAKRYLIHAFEVEPNSVSGRDGLLLAADSLYFARGYESYVEAENRYRDFLNRFPTSDRAAYAQFRIAQSLAARMEKPNRDQATTKKALAEFEDLLRLYPTSNYATEAREAMKTVYANLAEHEYRVGTFYMRYGCTKKRNAICRSAAQRFEYLLENYPTFEEKDKVYFQLCRAYTLVEAPPEGSTDGCGLLSAQYPDSKYLGKLPKTNRSKGKTDDEIVPSDRPAAGSGL